MAHTHFRTKGIVLEKTNRGEADQVFVVLTGKFGRIEVVGKAIRKITSKLRASIDIFYLIEIEFIQGKNQKILTDAILLKKIPQQSFHIFALVAEISSSLIIREGRDNHIWHLLLSCFILLQRGAEEGIKEKIAVLAFFWKLVFLLGFEPELFFCCECKKKLNTARLFFAEEKGGIVCSACLVEQGPYLLAREISVETVKAIRFFIKEPLEICSKLKLSQNQIKEISQTSNDYLLFLGRGF